MKENRALRVAETKLRALKSFRNRYSQLTADSDSVPSLELNGIHRFIEIKHQETLALIDMLRLDPEVPTAQIQRLTEQLLEIETFLLETDQSWNLQEEINFTSPRLKKQELDRQINLLNQQVINLTNLFDSYLNSGEGSRSELEEKIAQLAVALLNTATLAQDLFASGKIHSHSLNACMALLDDTVMLHKSIKTHMETLQLYTLSTINLSKN